MWRRSGEREKALEYIKLDKHGGSANPDSLEGLGGGWGSAMRVQGGGLSSGVVQDTAGEVGGVVRVTGVKYGRGDVKCVGLR